MLIGSAKPDESLLLKTTFGKAAASPLADLPGVVQADQSTTTSATLSLRRAQMAIEFFAAPHAAHMRVKSLKLDEIECASLRGHLTGAEVDLDFLRKKGDGYIQVQNPRFSGVQGSDLMLMCDSEHIWLNICMCPFSLTRLLFINLKRYEFYERVQVGRWKGCSPAHDLDSGCFQVRAERRVCHTQNRGRGGEKWHVKQPGRKHSAPRRRI